MSSYWGRIARHFLPLGFVLVFVCALLYVTNQQSLRLAADDALVDQAHGIATTLKSQSAKGAQASNLVDVANSNQLFVIILDKDNKDLYSTAQVDGATPVLPSDAIKAANDSGENRLTWSPKKDVRLATVVVPYTSPDEKGVVVVGKSLKEVEQRTQNIGKTILIGGAIGLVVLFAVLAILYQEPKAKQVVTKADTKIVAKPAVSNPVAKAVVIKKKSK
jgi:sensor histidine kinase regulating citrate/malate metabolism